MKVAFDGCNNQVVTFIKEGTIKNGALVKVTENGTVAAAHTGDEYIGVALSSKGEYVSVCISGIVTVGCRDTSITAGYVNLTSDNNGGVTEGAGNIYKFVLDVNNDAKTATILL